METPTRYHRLPKEDEIISQDLEAFDWNTAIENFEASVAERKKYPDFVQRGVRVVGIEDEDDETKFNLLPTLVSHHAELIPVVQEMRKVIEFKHAVKDPHRVNCHMFISLVSRSQCFDWHNDYDNTYIWQIKGRTKWYTGEDDAILEPNDMIYIPHGKMHRLEIIEPRISVSFSIERKV